MRPAPDTHCDLCRLPIFFEILALLVALEAAEAEIERLRSLASETRGETVIEGGVTTVKARARR